MAIKTTHCPHIHDQYDMIIQFERSRFVCLVYVSFTSKTHKFEVSQCNVKQWLVRSNNIHSVWDVAVIKHYSMVQRLSPKAPRHVSFFQHSFTFVEKFTIHTFSYTLCFRAERCFSRLCFTFLLHFPRKSRIVICIVAVNSFGPS